MSKSKKLENITDESSALWGEGSEDADANLLDVISDELTRLDAIGFYEADGQSETPFDPSETPTNLLGDPLDPKVVKAFENMSGLGTPIQRKANEASTEAKGLPAPAQSISATAELAKAPEQLKTVSSFLRQFVLFEALLKRFFTEDELMAVQQAPEYQQYTEYKKSLLSTEEFSAGYTVELSAEKVHLVSDEQNLYEQIIAVFEKELIARLEQSAEKKEEGAQLAEEVYLHLKNSDLYKNFKERIRFLISSQREDEARKQFAVFNHYIGPQIELIKKERINSLEKMKDFLSGIAAITKNINAVPARQIEILESGMTRGLMELFGVDMGGFFQVDNSQKNPQLKFTVFHKPEEEDFTREKESELMAVEILLKGPTVFRKNASESINAYFQYKYITKDKAGNVTKKQFDIWEFLKSPDHYRMTPKEGVGADVWIKLRNFKEEVIAIMFFDHTDDAHILSSRNVLLFTSMMKMYWKTYTDTLEVQQMQTEIEELQQDNSRISDLMHKVAELKRQRSSLSEKLKKLSKQEGSDSSSGISKIETPYEVEPSE